jgi:hypothetical protein
MKKNSFTLLELEMANLGCFFRKNGLGPLGVNPKSFLKLTMGLSTFGQLL